MSEQKNMISLQLRLPIDVRDWIAAEAERTERSQNGMIVWLLRRAMTQEPAE